MVNGSSVRIAFPDSAELDSVLGLFLKDSAFAGEGDVQIGLGGYRYRKHIMVDVCDRHKPNLDYLEQIAWLFDGITAADVRVASFINVAG
ncbi:MAG: hypothetical protein WC901_01480 [Candidatus Margulisiibacteriota bacterium]